MARLRRVLDFWRGQRSLRMEPISVVWPAHRSSETGLGSGLRLVVDDSRALCRGRAADGEFAEGRAGRLDQSGKLTATSGERKRMSDYPQRVTDSFNERKRLIRLRRKKENLRFWEEFRIIPRWLMALVAILYVLALVIAITVNLAASRNPNGNEMFPPDLRDNPALASLALAGIVTAASLSFAIIIFLIAYVNRDASRRGMSAALWT